MSLMWVILLFALGILLIVKGGDYFVDAATWIAEVSGIPKVIVGATVVSIATTLPEIIVSITAAISGSADIAVGNAIGSVTANTGLILSICALVSPFAIKIRDYALKGVLLVLATVSIYLFSLKGSLSIIGSIVLFAIFIIFIYENVKLAKENMGGDNSTETNNKETAYKIFQFVAGTAGIVIGARLLVDNGRSLAQFFGVPEAIIGVTLIAIGTSLPELVTTVVAVSKKQGALSVGNIIGANIIDTTLIVPICGMIAGKPLAIDAQSLMLDMPVCILTVALAVIPMLLKKKLMRWQGVLMISVYIAYLVLLMMFFVKI
ncbi:MAG: calcium/sodium antiporter [Clostridia bacterium]|nr:calcium/sodium antiporter [Clostridia bacterium]